MTTRRTTHQDDYFKCSANGRHKHLGIFKHKVIFLPCVLYCSHLHYFTDCSYFEKIFPLLFMFSSLNWKPEKAFCATWQEPKIWIRWSHGNVVEPATIDDRQEVWCSKPVWSLTEASGFVGHMGIGDVVEPAPIDDTGGELVKQEKQSSEMQFSTHSLLTYITAIRCWREIREALWEKLVWTGILHWHLPAHAMVRKTVLYRQMDKTWNLRSEDHWNIGNLEYWQTRCYQ